MHKNKKMNSEALYIQTGRLIETMPDLNNGKLSPEIYRWLGDAYAIVQESGDLISSVELKTAIDNITLWAEDLSDLHKGVVRSSINKIYTILFRTLSVAELSAPAINQGSFIPVGCSFDAMREISKILRKAQNDILIVDPYLDEKVLTDFVSVTEENITIRLLTDKNDHKPSIKPACDRWINQYGNKRPIKLKFASNKMLHDRIIVIDRSEVWVLTQSLKDIANRSPASIVRFDDPEIKINAYNKIWDSEGVENF